MFEDVKISWAGETYTVPANEQMVLIEKIESAIMGGKRGNALDILLNKGPTYLELSRAYSVALQHAGADVTQQDIYYKIQEDIAELSKENVAVDLHTKVMGLLSIMSPPIYHKLIGASSGKKPKKVAKD